MAACRVVCPAAAWAAWAVWAFKGPRISTISKGRQGMPPFLRAHCAGCRRPASRGIGLCLCLDGYCLFSWGWLYCWAAAARAAMMVRWLFRDRLMPGDSLTKSRHPCSSHRSKPACFRLRHRSRKGSNRAVRQVTRHQTDVHRGSQVLRSPLPSRTSCLSARTSASPASGTVWFANRALGLASVLRSEVRGAFPDEVVQSADPFGDRWENSRIAEGDSSANFC